MSRLGLETAKKFGALLPSFPDLATATRYFADLREDRLSKLSRLVAENGALSLDFSPDSLKQIESWYFNLYEKGRFENLGTDRNSFEEFMATYFGEVVVRNVPGAAWIVEEFAFAKGKYEFGVRKGLGTVMLGAFRDLFNWPGNKKRESIFRMYKKSFGSK